MDDLELPAFYVVNRGLPPEHARFIADALSITPVTVAIISDLADAPLAHELCGNILRAADSDEALEIAMTISGTDRPLVVGEAGVLDAVYPDGRREEVSIAC
jgi:hypothetical protein